MHKNKREEPNRAAKKENTAEEMLFHFDKEEMEKKDGTVAENLARDQQFRKFFTTSVIEVPEEMRKVDRAYTDNSAEENSEKKGRGFFRGLFARPEEDDEDLGVQIPEDAQEQAEETERSFAQKLERPEDTEDARPTPEPPKPSLKKAENKPDAGRAKPAAPQADLAAYKAPTADLAAPLAKPDAPSAKPAPGTAVPKAPQGASAAPEKVKMASPAKKAGTVDVGSLLEKIDEAQAVMYGEGTAAAKTTEPAEAKKAAQPTMQAAQGSGKATQREEAAETVVTLEPTPAELADRAPQKAERDRTEKKENVPPQQEKYAERTEDAAAIETNPAEKTQAAADTFAAKAAPQPAAKPRGRIVFADEATQPTEETEKAAKNADAGALLGKAAAEAAQAGAKAEQAAAEAAQRVAEPTGEEAQPANRKAEQATAEPAQADTEQPTVEAAQRAAEPTGAKAQPANRKAEQATVEPAQADVEPTGEVPLFAQEPTGEIGLDAQEPTGEVVLADEAAETEKPHPWQKLKNIFSGAQEPDEEPETEADEPARAPAEEEALEYTSAEDAEAIRGELEARTAALTLRCVLSGILAVALIVLDLMGQSVLPSPAIIDPVAAPAAWLGVHLILMAVCVALALPILKNGILSMLPHKEPSADSLATMAAVAAVLQIVVGLLQANQFDPAKITVFSGAAALLLFADLLGQRISMDSVNDGFAVMTSGVENAAGYRLKDKYLLHALSKGMNESEPVLLLSRPGSLLKNFMAQSFAPHRSDRVAVEFARTLGVVGLIGFAVTLIKGGGLLMAVSVLAAVQCMGAPLSATLIRAIPSRLMERAAAQVGAVVPGWPAIEQLGEVDMIHADAAELFPPMCAHLYGIKTFRKERVDLAILYATSILIESCNTLSGLFRNMIENHTDMLYPVKDLEKRPGLGFVAWCDNCRIVLGSRELMTQEGIALPAMDYENRYTQNGDRHVLYLAVSGDLYAMFLYGYSGTKKVAHTLGLLRRENIRLLITADDPTLTAARIEEAYRLRAGFIKVLSGEEATAMAPATAYQPTTEGCLVHLGGFASLAGGLQAAAGADGAEHNACTVQTVSVTVSVILGLLLSFTGGLAHISLAAVLLYQIAWSALGMALTLTKKY